MAQYNEILAGRFNRAMQKHFAMKGPASVNELSSIIQPNYNFFTGTEQLNLEGWDRFGRQLEVGLVAGQNDGFRIRNPQGSGVIAVLESILLMFTTACNGLLSGELPNTTTLVDLTNAGIVPLSYDPRGRSGASCILSTQNNSPGLPIPVKRFGLNAPAMLELIQSRAEEITLLPGHAIEVTTQTVAVLFDVSFAWRERALEESELR